MDIIRRGNGDGSIFKLSGKRRKPYAVRVTVGFTNEGKQQYKYIGYYETKTAAKKALTEYLVNPTSVLGEKHTLKDVFEAMIEKSKFSDGTIQQYTSGFNQLQILHNKSISAIKLEELELLIKDHTPSAQARIKKTLANCYKYAMKYEYVARNLADYLDTETIKSKGKTPFTVNEVNKLWEDLGSEKHDDLPLILLYTGLRISELLKLEIKHVNMDERTIYIAKSKTPSGIRTIPIHDKIFDLIKARYREGNKYLIMNDNKALPYSTMISSYWPYIRTIHETRHTFITHLTKHSTDEISIKKLVGHGITDITGRYTHRTIDELRKEVNKLIYK